MKATKSRTKNTTPSTNKQFSSFQKEVEELKQFAKLSRTLPEANREGKSISLNNYYSF